jgi:hypothetical protein
VFVACLLAGRQPGAGPPSRAQTLGEDLSGPRLDVIGTVAERLQDGDDTCFVLQVGGGWPGVAGGRLLACYPGPFDHARFGTGQTLRVTGALGPALPRSVAGRVLEYPLAAGAFISPAAAPAPGYGWSGYPPHHPFPSADPCFHPGHGVWYGSGWYRPGGGLWMGP